MPIAANGGLEAVAAAMTNHADHRAVQEWAAAAALNVFWSNAPPARIARAKAAGLVPLLRRAAGTDIPNAASALKKLGVAAAAQGQCPGYKKSGMFSSTCKVCGGPKNSH